MSSVTGTQNSYHSALDRGARLFSTMWGGTTEFFMLIPRAAAASSEYEALSRLSDRQLEDIGLTRESISRHVFHKHFG